MAFQSAVQAASGKSTKHPMGKTVGAAPQRLVSWHPGTRASPQVPAQTHLPHEHEEEAGRGHESATAGG